MQNISLGMKHRTSYQDKSQSPPAPSLAAATEEADLEAKGFMPSTDEVARKAYFTYENEGSRPGRDVQHWLKARQIDLSAQLTRGHGFHNKT